MGNPPGELMQHNEGNIRVLPLFGHDPGEFFHVWKRPWVTGAASICYILGNPFLDTPNNAQCHSPQEPWKASAAIIYSSATKALPSFVIGRLAAR